MSNSGKKNDLGDRKEGKSSLQGREQTFTFKSQSYLSKYVIQKSKRGGGLIYFHLGDCRAGSPAQYADIVGFVRRCERMGGRRRRRKKRMTSCMEIGKGGRNRHNAEREGEEEKRLGPQREK